MSKYKSLQQTLGQIDNDYTAEENVFFKLTGSRLVQKNNFRVIKYNQPTLSIVIPYLNALKSISHTLDSLESQKRVDLSKVEIILIDDGSKIFPFISKKKYDFNLKVIRFGENKGRVRVRNVGLLLASNDILMFLDADIILHNLVLYNHLLVHSTLKGQGRNLLLVGYREWVRYDDSRVNNKPLLLNDINLDDDHRINITYFEKHLPYIKNKSLLGKTVKVVAETNFLKDLGHSKSYMDYTLPEEVYGFLFSLPLKLALKAGPVAETEKGWGADDVLIASRFIAAGAKVVPLLNSRGLHLFDANPQATEEQKLKERKINREWYSKLLNEPFIEFTSHN